LQKPNLITLFNTRLT